MSRPLVFLEGAGIAPPIQRIGKCTSPSGKSGVLGVLWGVWELLRQGAAQLISGRPSSRCLLRICAVIEAALPEDRGQAWAEHPLQGPGLVVGASTFTFE